MQLDHRKILVVENDALDIAAVSNLLQQIKLQFQIAADLETAKNLLLTESFDVLLSDLHISSTPGREVPDGLEIIRWAKIHQPQMLIIAASSDPRADTWDVAAQAGAHHFIRKPIVKSDELLIGFHLAREKRQIRQPTSLPLRRESYWSTYSSQYPDEIVIDSQTLAKVKGLSKRHQLTCVLIGETGTGKEEIAKLIHLHRARREGAVPFVAVNCATLTQSLTESLLFGHRKGAFTGADQTTSGYVAEADGGILFLDEIHTLDLSCQQKLLRVLADGSYHRLGETRTYRSQFQLIAATTRDLDDEVDAGRFMLDLRGRLTGLDIHLPPLRERKDDIPAFLALFLKRRDLDLDPKVFHQLVATLASFYWRGNIRQFFKVLDSWMMQCEFEEQELRVESLPVFKTMLAPGESVQVQGRSDAINQIVKVLDQDSNLEASLEAFEKMLIANAIARHPSIADCCRALGVARSTFDNKRRRYQI